jgi:hypothetical protein
MRVESRVARLSMRGGFILSLPALCMRPSCFMRTHLTGVEDRGCGGRCNERQVRLCLEAGGEGARAAIGEQQYATRAIAI